VSAATSILALRSPLKGPLCCEVSSVLFFTRLCYSRKVKCQRMPVVIMRASFSGKSSFVSMSAVNVDDVLQPARAQLPLRSHRSVRSFRNSDAVTTAYLAARTRLCTLLESSAWLQRWMTNCEYWVLLSLTLV
jgi:hypothetical protein